MIHLNKGINKTQIREGVCKYQSIKLWLKYMFVYQTLYSKSCGYAHIKTEKNMFLIKSNNLI